MTDFTSENIEVEKVRIAECDNCADGCTINLKKGMLPPKKCPYDQDYSTPNWRETGTAILIKEKV